MKAIKRLFAAILVACIVASGVGLASNVAREALSQRAFSIIIKAPKPKKLIIVNPTKKLSLDDVARLNCIIKPAAALQDVMWYPANTVVSISDDGLVTPNRPGKVKITARAKAKMSVKASFTLEVYDPRMPTKITISPDVAVLQPGDTRELGIVTVPVDADKEVDWSTSNANVAYVDEFGTLRATGFGRATITAVAQNGGAKATALVVVTMPEVYTQIPERTTFRDLTAISENLKVIDDIYSCAVAQVARLSAAGTISSTERTRRIRVLSNAFDMYRFPWYTETVVRYWTRDYGTRKDFFPGNVYFGLPYIQSGATGSRVNRRYNVSRAVSQGYFVSRGNGVYQMTSKRLDGRYVGNDCSAFVGASTFVGNGYSIGNGVCFMLTSSILSSNLYKPVASYDDLRPGDIIVRGHDHALMFLYYVDEAKTRMMIIEQGGGTNADLHNTVTCSIVNRSKYETKYGIRRAKILA